MSLSSLFGGTCVCVRVSIDIVEGGKRTRYVIRGVYIELGAGNGITERMMDDLKAI